MNILTDEVLAPRTGKAWVVKKGQHVRVIDVEGGQIGDFIVFHLHNLRERFNQARTKADQGKIFISTGDQLLTRDHKALMTIVEDTYGIHDLQYGMCNDWVYKRKREEHSFAPDFTVGGPLGVPEFGCYEILQGALKDWPIAPDEIPDPLNLFQTVNIDTKTGKMALAEGRSKPGDYIDLVAEMDLLCALSACPSTGKPLRVQVYQP